MARSCVAEAVTIRSETLAATIAAHGAELQSLRDRDGRELMTNADPAFWTGRAPLLFPIVGRLQDDVLRHGGRSFAMAKHGFARRSDFALIAADACSALFRLEDSAPTRASYPFAFRLDARFTLDGATLRMTVTVANPGDVALPFSFGFHPAFAWPLPGGGAREMHAIAFERPEPGALARVDAYGTLAPEPKASPVREDRFTLDDALFADDALVWTRLASRGLRYGAPGHRQLAITFPDTPMLGIWTKPGASFICIEPWAGHADPQGYDGAFASKPGVMSVPAGEERQFRMDVRLEDGGG